MKSSQRLIFLAFILGCAAGGLAGAYAQRRAFQRFWRRGPDTARIERKLERELTLDGNQKESVHELLEKERARMAELQKDTAARFAQMRQDMRVKISRILRPDQQAKFTEMTAQWDARRKLLQDGPGSRP